MRKFLLNILADKKLMFNLLILLILFYFIFHTIGGNRGIIAYFKLNQQIEKSNIELDVLKAERIDLEHKVTLLKSPIDRDMLDEQARKVLGVAGPREKVFVVSE